MIRSGGLCIFPGLAMGEIHRVVMQSHDVAPAFQGAATEIANLETAVRRSEDQLEKIRAKAATELGATEAEIFEAHRMMLTDPEFLDGVRDRISNKFLTAPNAVTEVSEEFVTVLESAGSEYLRERAADMRDVAGRLRRNILAPNESPVPTTPFIILASDLAPSDLMSLSGENLRGVVLTEGGATSHTAILLKSMGVPSLFQADALLPVLKEKDLGVRRALLDSREAQATIDPDQTLWNDFEGRLSTELARQRALAPWKERKTVLADGYKLPLHANVGSQKQIVQAFANGAEGIGLYRTEFLFMDRATPPSYEEQLKIYREALTTAAGKPVVIRTLDIGGDKQIPYLKLPREENPFLGVRGLRLCLRHPELFATQIRALWNAADEGPLDVMFPMVTTLDELRETFALIAKTVGSSDAVPKKPGLRWGMMLEIPANVFMVREFATLVDFFSVGTNDLVQYLTACDRQNPQLARLSDSYSPAVLRALDWICREVAATGKDLSVCGEMASDPLLAPTLVGLGVKKLSLNSALIAGLRFDLSKLRQADLLSLAQRAIATNSGPAAKSLLSDALPRHLPTAP